MTEQHSITPPPELVAKLWKQAAGDGLDDAPIGEIFNHGVLLAYAAGADHQLAEDAKWLDHNALNESHLRVIPMGAALKEAMRPKPPSDKELAIKALGRKPGRGHAIMIDDTRYDTILAALQALPND